MCAVFYWRRLLKCLISSRLLPINVLIDDIDDVDNHIDVNDVNDVSVDITNDVNNLNVNDVNETVISHDGGNRRALNSSFSSRLSVWVSHRRYFTLLYTETLHVIFASDSDSDYM